MASNVKLSTSTVVQIPITELIPDPNQPRHIFDKGALQTLAENIKERGIQVPILVRLKSDGKKNQTLIKDGERRWRAAKLAKLKTVPVLLAHSGDASQILIDQVAVNDLRERLKPMEVASALVKMRDGEKLSANEIAARMSKQGLLLSQAQIANMMKLTELPTWAADMVNDGQIEVTAARELTSITDKTVMATLERMMKQAVDWRGKVVIADVQHSIRSAYRQAAAADLKHVENYFTDAVRFDYKKVCKGCPHLVTSHGMALCMDKAGFQQHQKEAAEAGLENGGKKMQPAEAVKAQAAAGRKLTPKQQAKLDAEKAQARAASLADKTKSYLHRWASERIRVYLPGDTRDTAQRLIEFAAAQRPGLTNDFGYTPSYLEGRRAGTLRSVARKAGYPALPAFLAARDSGSDLYAALADEIVQQLPFIETIELAHHLFGKDIVPQWKVDPDYLDLLQKAELLQVAEKHATLPQGRKAWSACKTDEIKAAILAVAEKVGVPPTLAQLYAEPGERELADMDEDFEADDEDRDDTGHDDDEEGLGDDD